MWKTTAAGAIVTTAGRVAAALVTDDGVVHAAAYPAGTETDAAAGDLVLLLREHPDLNSVGVDLMLNHPGLRSVLAGDHRIAGAHVTVLDPNSYPSGSLLLADAVAAATRAATAAGTVALRAATDGSRDRRRSGYGWVTEAGEYGYGPIKAATVLETELVALERLLAATDADQPLDVEMDSRAAIKLARQALDVDVAVPDYGPDCTNAVALVLSRIRRHRHRIISLRWVRGHASNALNNAADGLAELGRCGLDRYLTDERVAEVAADRVAANLAADAA